jgi:transcription termination factor Rho
MKTLDYIPTSKIERATKLVQTGAKVVVILDTIVEK